MVLALGSLGWFVVRAEVASGSDNCGYRSKQGTLLPGVRSRLWEQKPDLGVLVQVTGVT